MHGDPYNYPPEKPMTTLEEMLAALTPEERARVEQAAEAGAAQKKAAEFADKVLRDERQDGPLQDPRDLGPVGG